MVTPALKPECDTAIDISGRVSRNQAGAKVTLRATVSVNLTSREKSVLLLAAIAVRDSPQLLAAAAVEERKLVDGRHLVQQLRVIGAALLQRIAVVLFGGTCARHPADLALQLGDRLLDPPRGGFGLFRHAVGQRGAGRAVADPGFHRAVDGEHEHHQPDQRDDVFGEQPFAEKPDSVADAAHPDPRARHHSGCARMRCHRPGRPRLMGAPPRLAVSAAPSLARIWRGRPQLSGHG
jgi:hypothetical protein